jgi:hypothetical protein
MTKPDISDTVKKRLLEALEASLGVVTTACKAAKVSRDTHYRWIKEDPLYAAAVQELSDVAVDFAESNLHKLIQEGNPSATIFYLKTKGKKRGYVETTDITTGGNALREPTWFDQVLKEQK